MKQNLITCFSIFTVLVCNVSEVNILEYAESHAKEIQDMMSILKEEPCGQNVSQKIPRHMRRRAMGHDVKRLPRSVRAMVSVPVMAEFTSTMKTKLFVCIEKGSFHSW